MIATSGYRRRIAGHAHLAPPSPRRRALATSVRPMAELSPQPSVRHRPGRPVRRQFGRRQLRRRGATFRTSARPQPRFPTTSIRPNATTSIRPLTAGSTRNSRHLRSPDARRATPARCALGRMRVAGGYGPRSD
jgi:hypothetical protein